MGLFDIILGSVIGAGSEKGPLGNIAATLITNHSSGKGLAGLVEEFEQHGLGPIVQSWVGTGQNLPITGEQIQQVLGSGVVQQLAAKAGVDPEKISNLIAQFLPKVVDQLTPDGKVPEPAESQQCATAAPEKSEERE